MDHPDERRVHSNATPRGGGVAIILTFFVIGFLLISQTFFDLRIEIIEPRWFENLSFAASLLLIIGLLDDRFGLSASMKLIGQIMAASIMFYGETRFGGVWSIPFPFLMDFLATILFFVVLINAFNLIDGYDGLAAGLASVAGLGLLGTFAFRHLPLEALLMTCFVGACLGFLRHNLYPAKVFLGDTGSMFLGFVLASFMLVTASKGTGIAAIWVPLLGFSLPLFDAGLAVWRRAGRRLFSLLEGLPFHGGIMSADMDHLHHRLAALGVTPRNVSAILILFSAFLVFLGTLSLFYRDVWLAAFVIGLLIAIPLSVRICAGIELRESGLLLETAMSGEQHSRKSLLVFALFDFSIASISFILSHWFLALPYAAQWSGSSFSYFWYLLPVCALLLVLPPYSFLRFQSLPHSQFGLIFLLGAILFSFGLRFSDYAISELLFFSGILFCLSSGIRLLPRFFAPERE